MYIQSIIRLLSHGIELAEHKTEAALVSRRKLKEILRFRVGQDVIESKPFIKNLVVMLDLRLTFTPNELRE